MPQYDCRECTLQLIQVMGGASAGDGSGWPSNYYACANIKIESAADTYDYGSSQSAYTSPDDAGDGDGFLGLPPLGRGAKTALIVGGTVLVVVPSIAAALVLTGVINLKPEPAPLPRGSHQSSRNNIRQKPGSSARKQPSSPRKKSPSHRGHGSSRKSPRSHRR